MTVREGRWDCQYCATKGILGRHKTCMVCFAARPAGTRFYLPTDSAAVTDAELLGYAQKGPDWVCAFCSTSNPADVRICRSCQSERSVDAHTQEIKTYEPGDAPQAGDMALDPPAPEAETERDRTDIIRSGSRPKRNSRLIGIGVLLLVCLFGAIFASRFLIPNDVSAALSRVEWERTVEIEELRTVTESDWTLPSNAILIDQEEQIRTYDEVISGYVTEYREVPESVYVGDRDYVCGQRDLGNGFFEDVICSEPIYETTYRTEAVDVPVYESVPVYDTFYTYEIDKWTLSRTERVTGADQGAYWPETSLGEFEREGERYENYVAVFTSANGETYRLDLPYQRWASLGIERRYDLDVNAFGEVQGLSNGN